jgi:hypothetical protein
VSQEWFKEKESQQGGQNGKKCDDHHDDANTPPAGLEDTEDNQEKGVKVHHANQPSTDLGRDSPDKEDLGPVWQGHQDDEGWQSIRQQYQENELYPLR